jgi:hypothetical protein
VIEGYDIDANASPWIIPPHFGRRETADVGLSRSIVISSEVPILDDVVKTETRR